MSIAKSNSPQFFQRTFKKCLTKLSQGRQSPTDFELAKQKLPDVAREAIRQIRAGEVDLADLEYRVELREDPQEKSQKTLPQAYQAAWLLSKTGKNASRGEIMGFVKVHPFRFEGRKLTVKPTLQTSLRDINVDDYVRNLISSLSQSFAPMGINLDKTESKLSDFV